MIVRAILSIKFHVISLGVCKAVVSVMHKVLDKRLKNVYDQKTISGLVKRLHCKFLPHENYKTGNCGVPAGKTCTIYGKGL